MDIKEQATTKKNVENFDLMKEKKWEEKLASTCPNLGLRGLSLISAYTALQCILELEDWCVAKRKRYCDSPNSFSALKSFCELSTELWS